LQNTTIGDVEFSLAIIDKNFFEFFQKPSKVFSKTADYINNKQKSATFYTKMLHFFVCPIHKTGSGKSTPGSMIDFIMSYELCLTFQLHAHLNQLSYVIHLSLN